MSTRFGRWLDEPQPIERLEAIRILTPLAILGFLSSRIAEAGEWVGDRGFRIPPLENDYRRPIDLPAVSGDGATLFCAVMVIAALCVSAGFRARIAALVFGALVAYAALSDRLSTFTVTKMTPMIMLALALSPCGRAYSVDAWLARRRGKLAPALVAGGSVRFFQAFLCTMYCASGLSKAHGDWLKTSLVLYSNLHDTLQTWLSVWMANHVPAAGWFVLQGSVLAFEIGAPVWFSLARTRTYAVIFGLGMHAMIGMLFWPVRWFALLMMVLLTATFAPAAVLKVPARLLPVRYPSK